MFSPALEGSFIWDDVALVEQNRYIKEPGGIGRALGGELWSVPLAGEGGSIANYYRPLVTLSRSARLPPDLAVRISQIEPQSLALARRLWLFLQTAGRGL